MEMSLNDFCSLSLNEYQLRCKGFRLKEAKEWDRTRHLMWVVVAVNAGKKAPKGPEDILAIPDIDKHRKGGKNDLFAAHYRLKARLMAEQLTDGGTG